MKLKPRALSTAIMKAARTFPAVVLTGPRQSGKTTLLKMLLSKTHGFVSLEDPDVRLRAKADPVGFLEQCGPATVIDEIQYLPDLLSYIKTRIDQDRKPGRWVLTGLQNFVLMDRVAQSLAGRAAVLNLLPFSLAERLGHGESTLDVASWVGGLDLTRLAMKRIDLSEVLLRGLYPEIASNRRVDRQLWCGSYVNTYLERDIRNLTQVGDLGQFERFVLTCATRTGQILNLSDMARQIGVSVPTAKRWLSLLETGFQVVLLYPYYRNIGKRLVKSPKLYFTDPALAAYFLGIHTADVLCQSPSLGPLFETLIVSDFLKRFAHLGQRPSMYYLRTQDGLEVDLVIEVAGRLHLFEVKASQTITDRHAVSLKRLRDHLGPQVQTTAILSCTHENFLVQGQVANYGWANVLDV